MQMKIKAAAIGLDTMHTVEFARLLQDPAAKEKVEGMEITKCLTFETPFQSRQGLEERRQYLESLGIGVTEDFDEAVSGCDAILLNIDDASLHREYFERCVKLGKPIYVDKPLADSMENAMAMVQAARRENIRFFTASALRYDIEIARSISANPNPSGAFVYGALGKAPAGSSIVWYSIHCFEILELAMGRGAAALTWIPDRRGAVCHVAYRDGRRGVIEFTHGCWEYGGILHMPDGRHESFRNSREQSFYVPLLRDCVSFFRGESDGVKLEDSIEIMAMIDAAERSCHSGHCEPIYIG